jgi:multiple antibiotic resistance protein
MTIRDDCPVCPLRMDDTLLKFGLTAFATLLVVVDPFGVLPIFISLARNRPVQERAGIATRAVLLAFLVSLFFLVAGHATLAFLGVSVYAFSISGGILLFATAVPMLFGQRPALQSAETNESGPEDIAVFPLAIPLLSGPGTITSVLLLTAQAGGSLVKLAVVAAAIALVFLLTRFVIGFGAERLMRLLRPAGLHLVTRLLGILLAALAVQFVLGGIAEFVRVLEHSRG